MNCTLHIDGGARGNPGPAGAGIVLRDADTGRTLHEAGYFLGRTTNNVAEYRGLLHGLELAAELGPAMLTIYSDSQLMVRQLLGEYRVKAAQLKPLYEQAGTLLAHFPRYELRHVKREQNARADELANLAMDRRADVVVSGQSGGANAADADGEPLSGTGENGGGGGGDGSVDASDAATGACWCAELLDSLETCVLAGHEKGAAYTFGPTTPEGFCVYAASAVFEQGPLYWPPEQGEAHTQCRLCGMNIRIERLS